MSFYRPALVCPAHRHHSYCVVNKLLSKGEVIRYSTVWQTHTYMHTLCLNCEVSCVYSNITFKVRLINLFCRLVFSFLCFLSLSPFLSIFSYPPLHPPPPPPIPPFFDLSYLTYSASGTYEHLYYEAILNNRSSAPCDRRTGDCGETRTYANTCTQTEQGDIAWGKQSARPTLSPSSAVCEFVVFTGLHLKINVTAPPQQKDQNLHNEEACALHRFETSSMAHIDHTCRQTKYASPQQQI